MDRDVLVYVDLEGTPHLVGHLWARLRRNTESATFEYDPGWLDHPARFPLEPALQLGPGPFHTADRPMFGAIGDSAPDRWGRTLMRRMERRRAEQEGGRWPSFAPSSTCASSGPSGRPCSRPRSTCRSPSASRSISSTRRFAKSTRRPAWRLEKLASILTLFPIEDV